MQIDFRNAAGGPKRLADGTKVFLLVHNDRTSTTLIRLVTDRDSYRSAAPLSAVPDRSSLLLERDYARIAYALDVHPAAERVTSVHDAR